MGAAGKILHPRRTGTLSSGFRTMWYRLLPVGVHQHNDVLSWREAITYLVTSRFAGTMGGAVKGRVPRRTWRAQVIV